LVETPFASLVEVVEILFNPGYMEVYGTFFVCTSCIETPTFAVVDFVLPAGRFWFLRTGICSLSALLFQP